MDNYVSISELAAMLGLDRSNTRKYAIKNGFNFSRIRTESTKGQLTLALPPADAAALLDMRRKQGYGSGTASENGRGYFYVVQPVPELDPLRVKLGWATDAKSRLAAYTTISPEAKLLKFWPCRLSWERAAIASVTRTGCEQIGQEVFTCNGIQDILERCEQFFALMPKE